MGHPVLRARARAMGPAKITTPRIQDLIDSMFETMQEYQGVGLAAPQVHVGLRVFVAGFPPRRAADEVDDAEDAENERMPLITLINPEITVVGTQTADDWEGCLSIPDVRGRVPRPLQIEVRAYDRRGRKIRVDAKGFIARVIQLETDHLDGILFFDRMKSLETLTFLEEHEVALLEYARRARRIGRKARGLRSGARLRSSVRVRISTARVPRPSDRRTSSPRRIAAVAGAFGDQRMHLLADAAVRRDAPCGAVRSSRRCIASRAFISM